MKRLCILLWVMTTAFVLQACPYIDNGYTDIPEVVKLEDLQGCFYNETKNKGTYMNRRSTENEWLPYDGIVCSKMCISGDLATFFIKGRVVLFDSSGQIAIDTNRITHFEYQTSIVNEKAVNIVTYGKDTSVFVYTTRISVLSPSIDGNIEHSFIGILARPFIRAPDNTQRNFEILPDVFIGDYISGYANEYFVDVQTKDGEMFIKAPEDFTYLSKEWNVCKDF